MQQHQFVIEFEAQRVAEGGFDRERAEIVGRAAHAPQFEWREGERVRMCGVLGDDRGGRLAASRPPVGVHRP